MSEYWIEKKVTVIGKEIHKPRESVKVEKGDPLKSSRRPWLSVISLATRPILNTVLSFDPREQELQRIIEEATVLTDEEIALGIEHQNVGDDLKRIIDLDVGLKNIIEKPNEEGEKK